MIEQLIAMIHGAWSRLSPVFIVPCYQVACVLRAGKYSHKVEAGWHWKIPLIDEVHHVNSVMTTLRLQPQTCTTKDGHSVVVTGVVKYKIVDIEPYIKGVWDQRDVLTDVTMGAILAAVRERSFEELVDEPPCDKVATAVRRQVNRFGFEIISVTFVDSGRVRSLRLISHIPLEHILEE